MAADEHDWQRIVAQRPLDREEQQQIALQLAHVSSENQQRDEEQANLRVSLQELEEQRDRAAEAAIKGLPVYTRYSRVEVKPLLPEDEIFKYLARRFRESATQHFGPFTNQPPQRDRPKFKVERISALHNPRAAEAYMTELQDLIGLCNQGLPSQLERTHFAGEVPLQVESVPSTSMNEYMLYHGFDANRFDRLFQQGLDNRYAGSNAGTARHDGSNAMRAAT